jgi:hypothetical protein
MESRYIVWQEEKHRTAGSSVRDMLYDFPDVEILRSHDPDSAVVLMDSDTEQRLREEHPSLSVEPDIRHRLVAHR